MKYNQDIIDSILDSANILDIIGSHLNIQKKGSSYIALCPFHNDSKPSMHIHPQKQIYKCFACGAKGNVYTFLMEYENKTFPESVRFLAEKYGITLPQNEYRNIRNSDEYIYIKDINDMAKTIYHRYLFRHKDAKAGRDYLRSRGIGKYICDQFNIGYSPAKYQFIFNFMKNKYSLKQLLSTGLFYCKAGKPPIDFFRNRIMFPIYNDKNEIVGFGGRIIEKGNPKYLNTSETVLFKKSSLLYGLNTAYSDILKTKEVFIVEGYLDVIACQTNGIPAVATLGTTLTSQQIRKLKRYANQIYLIFDGDIAGRSAALRSTLLMMELGADGYILLLPNTLDPFDYFKKHSKEEFRDFLSNHKVNIYDFFVGQKVPQKDLSPAQKLNIASEIARNIANISDEIILSELRKKIANRLSIKVDVLIKLEKTSSNSRKKNYLPQANSSNKQNLRLNNRKKNKMEMDFVLFLCNSPQFISQASCILFSEDFEDPRANFMYRKLLDLRQEKNINFHRVIDIFKDEKIKDYLTTYALKFNIPEENNEKTFKDYLCKIKMYMIDRTLNKIQKQISLADAVGDFDQVVKLMEEKQLKIIEKDNLNTQFRS